MIYEIAGLRVNIKNRCRFTERFCAEYLSEDQTSPFDVQTEVTKEEFLEEKEASPNFPDGYVENVCLYRKLCQQMPERNRFLLHSAVVEYRGNGYAFLGKSGTGKSTHSALWLNNLPSSSMLNGDKPILEIKEGEVLVYGTPWMGKEGLGRRGVAPLKGLCFLEQAKENRITRLSASEAAERLFVQLLFPSDEANAAKTLEHADELLKLVPAYLLQCNISEEAAALSFHTMTGLDFFAAKEGKYED